MRVPSFRKLPPWRGGRPMLASLSAHPLDGWSASAFRGLGFRGLGYRVRGLGFRGLGIRG